MEQEFSYEEAFFEGNYKKLVEKIDLSPLKSITHIEFDFIIPLYFLIRSHERYGHFKLGWEIFSLLEEKMNNFDNKNEQLNYLIFINLKVILLSENGLLQEALSYLPIFGEEVKESSFNQQIFWVQKFIAWYYFGFGNVYQKLGDIETAFKFYMKALSIVNNDESNLRTSAEVYNKIGEIFFIKGETIHANKNFMIALSLSETAFYKFVKFQVLINLLELNLYLENYSEVVNLFNTIFPIKDLIIAPNILGQLYFVYFRFKISSNTIENSQIEKEYYNFKKFMSELSTEESMFISAINQIGESIYLNKINSIDSVTKSKNILETNLSKLTKVNLSLSIIARKELCEIYLKEIKFLKKTNSFNSFQKLNQELLTIAKGQHLYPLLIEVFLLDSKRELLFNEQNNLLNAELFLTLADIIAEEKKLKRLSSKILLEEINFKNQVDRWISLLPNKKNNLVNIKDLEEDKSFNDLKKLLMIEKPF